MLAHCGFEIAQLVRGHNVWLLYVDVLSASNCPNSVVCMASVIGCDENQIYLWVFENRGGINRSIATIIAFHQCPCSGTVNIHSTSQEAAVQLLQIVGDSTIRERAAPDDADRTLVCCSAAGRIKPPLSLKTDCVRSACLSPHFL